MEAVPWVFTDSPFIKAWTWKTTHFEAKVLSSGNKNDFTWKVVDTSGGEAKILGQGEAMNFQASEEEVLELIGKSYPRRLGYQKYAGHLATTFTLHNGKKIDLGVFYGQQVILTVFNKNAPMTPTTISGSISVSHYKVLIKTDRNSTVSIPPEYIMSIRKEFDTEESLIVEVDKQTAKNERRIFNEEWRRGCTGKPGFRIGTVIHAPSDEYCPIHD